jgi:large subunit ribosomal protein L4
MKKNVYAVDGKELRTIELNDKVFNIDVSSGSIYNAIKNELANKRTGTSSTKSRGEVNSRKGARGTSRGKAWRQKGTGRARAGRKGSPVWVGGGIAFGPKPRDFSYTIPKKVKRLAIKSILSLKNKEDKLRIIEDFNIESGKTKDLFKILKNHTGSEKTLIIMNDDSRLIKQAGRNIPWLDILSFNRLRAHNMYYVKNLIILETAAKSLNEFYGDKK